MKFLRRLNNILRKFEEFIIAYAVIVMASLTIINVFARNVANHSLTFVQEFNEFLIVFITFLGTSYAARNGRHIRMSALYDLLGDRAKKIMMYIMTSITSLLLFYMTYMAGKYVWQVYQYGRVSKVLTIPLVYIWIWVPIGLFLAAIQYGLAFIKNIAEEDVWISFEERAEYADLEQITGGEVLGKTADENASS